MLPSSTEIVEALVRKTERDILEILSPTTWMNVDQIELEVVALRKKRGTRTILHTAVFFVARDKERVDEFWWNPGMVIIELGYLESRRYVEGRPVYLPPDEKGNQRIKSEWRKTKGGILAPKEKRLENTFSLFPSPAAA